MISEPEFKERDEIPYVAIRKVVPMREIAQRVPPLIPQIYEWLDRRGHDPAGPLFFRYLHIDDGNQLDLEVGVPLAEKIDGDDRIRPGSFPAGRYAVARYKGTYDGLPQAWSAFEEWREREGVAERAEISPGGHRRGTRAEHYLVGPNENPDPNEWVTELALYLGETG